MKKLVFILAVLAIGMIATAQDFNLKTYLSYTGVASDTVNGSSDYEYVTWQVLQDGLYYYQVEAEIDEISGSATAYVQLEGSNDNSHWNLIDTLATYSGGTEAVTADNTVYLGDLSTGVMWRYLRTKLFISTTGKWDYNYVIVRIAKKED
jgi:hypothetical protein